MIKSYEQFRTYFYLYILISECDEDEGELFFNLDYLRKKISLYLLCNPIWIDANHTINNLDDLLKHFKIYGKIN